MQLSVLKELIREHFGAPKDYATAKTRTREMMLPRHTLRFVLRTRFHLSHSKVMLLTGHGDHSTSVHSNNAVNDLLWANEEIGKRLKEFLKKLDAQLDTEIKNGYGESVLEID